MNVIATVRSFARLAPIVATGAFIGCGGGQSAIHSFSAEAQPQRVENTNEGKKVFDLKVNEMLAFAKGKNECFGFGIDYSLDDETAAGMAMGEAIRDYNSKCQGNKDLRYNEHDQRLFVDGQYAGDLVRCDHARGIVREDNLEKHYAASVFCLRQPANHLEQIKENEQFKQFVATARQKYGCISVGVQPKEYPDSRTISDVTVRRRFVLDCLSPNIKSRDLDVHDDGIYSINRTDKGFLPICDRIIVQNSSKEEYEVTVVCQPK